MFPAYGLTVCVPSVFSAKAAPPRPAPEFRYCFSCNESVDTLRWDKHTRYTTHADNARRRRNLMDNSLKMDAPDRLPEFHLNGPSTLDQQFRSFMDQVYLSPEKRDDICKKMRSALEPDLRNAFGHFEVQCYGSMVTGLAFDGSDVDFRVVVASGGCDGRFRIWEHEEHSKVFRLAQQLYRDPAFANVLPLYAAKTPVLRALHVPSAPEGRKVDVTFGFPFSLANTHIVRHYLNLNPRFLEVMLVIKYWAKKNKICKSPHALSTHGWSLLWIAYLQSLRLAGGERLVPTVHQVQQRTPPAQQRMVRGMRVDFESHPGEQVVLPDDRAFSRLGLLAGFFSYYAEFDFRARVVSPFAGEPIDVGPGAESPGAESPGPAGRDRLAQARRRAVDAFRATRKNYVGAVQEPVNHKVLLTASKKTLTRIQKLLASASALCQGHLQSGAQESLLLEELFSATIDIDQNGNTTRRKRAAAAAGPPPDGPLQPPGLPRHSFAVFLRDQCLSPDQLVARASTKIRVLFEKIMTFFVEPMGAQGPSAQQFKCTPLTPPAWQFLGKRVMRDLVPEIPHMGQQELNSELVARMKARRVRFRFLRPKRERDFVCTVSLTQDFCVEVAFEPCSQDGVGFARHVANYLRTSLGSWLNAFQ